MTTLHCTCDYCMNLPGHAVTVLMMITCVFIDLAMYLAIAGICTYKLFSPVHIYFYVISASVY